MACTVLEEHGERPRALSWDEVRRESLPAWNLRGADRYYYAPQSGAVLFGDALDLPHTYPWRVTNQEVLPKEGWAHDDGCDCRSCRRPQAQSGAGADERPR